MLPAALDLRALEALRAQAHNDPQAATRAGAQQFEALFLGMLLSSLRESLAAESTGSSGEARLYWSLFDQQVAALLARRGIGLGAEIARALERAAPAPNRASPPAADSTPSPTPAAPAATSSLESARAFVAQAWPHALETARATGIAPQFLLAQAALESNWGRAEPRGAGGERSYNVFGVKAGGSWSGPVIEAQTTEFVGGAMQRITARFRAYGSYAEAFQDYARLLRSQPRYETVLQNGRDAEGFARALARAGYATDPMYAEKLLRVIHGGVLRQALAS